jgi:hypothetical protein
LESVFSGKSEPEVRIWLGQNGYTNSQNNEVLESNSSFARKNYSDLKVDYFFMSTWSRQSFAKLPYGNNFKRWFIIRDSTFELGVGTDLGSNQYYVHHSPRGIL